jgi:MATE family multidrug resistance protein
VIYVGLSTAVAFGDALRVRVAYGIGIGSVHAARQSASIATYIGTLFILGATLILWLVPEFLVGVFLNIDEAANTGVLSIAIGLSFYAGLFQLVDGVLIIFSNGLRGLRDTRSPLWISIFGYWVVGLAPGMWLCLYTEIAAPGMWLGLIAGAVVALVLMIFRLRSQFHVAELRLRALA